jgi:predicted porin
MNKNIKLAVAGAVLALSATAANAGIVIPAGDWTLDVSGNVNMYTTWANGKGGNTIVGGYAQGAGGTNNSMGNGLLPNFLSFTGTTRQNDLDVSWTISLQPGSANQKAVGGVYNAGFSNDAGGLNNRQSFITFGDKSWGSVKIGKDLGIYASDAILNDMTLLGVGGATPGGNTSLGRIGFGYIYADWKPQISYTTPNFSGLQATAGITKAFDVSSYDTSASLYSGYVDYAGNINSSGNNANVAYEGKASYSFAANDVTGKIWVSGIAQHVSNLVYNASFSSALLPGTRLALPASGLAGNDDPMAYSADIGANLKVAGFDLTGYYYGGSGIGTTGQMLNGYGVNSTSGKIAARDSDGGYVQAKYTLPTKTVVGLSWGISHLDLADGERNDSAGKQALVKSNEMWDLMVVHPLTKHLNLVAEYAYQQSENQGSKKNDANVGSLGAILFF